MRDFWLLTIDTSSARGGVAVRRVDPHGVLSPVLSVRRYQATTTHAERIVSEMKAAIEEAGARIEDIGVVGVSVGPGSFTGVRVGVATAKGLALSLGVRVVGVSSLEVLARATRAGAGTVRAPVIDAKRSEVYLAAYEDDGLAILPPAHLSIERSADALRALGRPLVLSGDGAALLPNDLPRDEDAVLPDVVTLSELVAERSLTDRFDDAAGLEPSYVRPPDAVPVVALDPGRPPTLQSPARWTTSAPPSAKDCSPATVGRSPRATSSSARAIRPQKRSSSKRGASV